MGMAKETELGCLLGKTGGGIQLVQHIAPSARILQRGMNYRESSEPGDKREGSEPSLLGRRKLVPRPLDCDFGQWVEAFQ